MLPADAGSGSIARYTSITRYTMKGPRRADGWLRSRFVAGTATSRFRGNHLAREGRLARASALLLMHRVFYTEFFVRQIGQSVGSEIECYLARAQSACPAEFWA